MSQKDCFPGRGQKSHLYQLTTTKWTDTVPGWCQKDMGVMPKCDLEGEGYSPPMPKRQELQAI